jgi:hypothetical protein
MAKTSFPFLNLDVSSASTTIPLRSPPGMYGNGFGD